MQAGENFHIFWVDTEDADVREEALEVFQNQRKVSCIKGLNIKKMTRTILLLRLNIICVSWPAVALKLFGFISAVKEASLKELHSHHSKDEHEE